MREPALDLSRTKLEVQKKSAFSFHATTILSFYPNLEFHMNSAYMYIVTSSLDNFALVGWKGCAFPRSISLLR